MAHYMDSEVQVYCYNEIQKADSGENAVDTFWLNLLPDYFRKREGFGIEYEARPLPEIVNQRANWTIRLIRNGESKKVILMHDRRRGQETSDAAWVEALDQLTRYLELVQTEQGQDKSQILYGAVNISTYTRFYQLDPFEAQCIDYSGANGKAYEVKKDEEEVHTILTELVEKTS